MRPCCGKITGDRSG